MTEDEHCEGVRGRDGVSIIFSDFSRGLELFHPF